MSNILERHLEQNIEPNTSKESYIDKAIQIFQDMKEDDITLNWTRFKDGNKYCLNGLFSRMTGFKDGYGLYCTDCHNKLGYDNASRLTNIHSLYCNGSINFEQMRQQAIQYMESLK